jgi:hypothetical protein
MEVHHHPDMHHKRKYFKEYFLEFLMIFLAVTMGFFAENIREHFTETKSAHQYLEAYRNDLLQNQKLIQREDSVCQHQLPVYDSIVAIFYERKENEELPSLSRLLLQGQVNRVISINMPTYQQLISSGSMRYIDNTELKDSISKYQENINSFINYNDRLITTLNSQMIEIFKIEDVHDFWNRHKNPVGYLYTPEMQPFALQEEDRKSIIGYNRLFSVQSLWVSIYIRRLLNSNIALVKLIDKELEK